MEWILINIKFDIYLLTEIIVHFSESRSIASHNSCIISENVLRYKVPPTVFVKSLMRLISIFERRTLKILNMSR